MISIWLNLFLIESLFRWAIDLSGLVFTDPLAVSDKFIDHQPYFCKLFLEPIFSCSKACYILSNYILSLLRRGATSVLENINVPCNFQTRVLGMPTLKQPHCEFVIQLSRYMCLSTFVVVIFNQRGYTILIHSEFVKLCLYSQVNKSVINYRADFSSHHLIDKPRKI